MKRLRSTARRGGGSPSRDERGVTLIVVMAIMSVVLLLGTMLASSSIFHLPMALQQNEQEQAFQAAEAGIADFTSYLNNDANYWHDAAAMAANPAFSQWVKVPGAPNDESFRYSVDSSTIAQGYLTLEASGCAAATFSATSCTSKVIRTLQVQLKPDGFTDYVYFTNYELANPATTPGTTCRPYPAWQNNGTNSSNPAYDYGPTGNCSQELGFWGTGTEFQGPVHTNDALRLCGDPVFDGKVDSYFANSPTSGGTPNPGLGGSSQPYLKGWINNKFQSPTCSAAPTYKAGPIAAGYDLPMPASNTNLQSLVDSSQGGSKGCLFSGYTALSFYYVGTTGYISYNSPYTNFAGASWNSSVCGTPASGTTKGVITVPATGLVVYVQAATATTTTSTDLKACTNASPQIGQGPDQCGGDVAVGDAPVSTQFTMPSSPYLPSADNGAPPAAPSGATGGLAGQVTVASADGVQIYSDLQYRTPPPQWPNGAPSGASVSTDMLGLIAENDIMLVHDPSNSYYACPYQSSSTQDFCENPVIDGALLSIHGAFYVQNWSSGGPLGNVTFNGSLALNYDGITGVQYSNGSLASGYNEVFVYDPRLAFSSPPYFLSPSTTYWEQLHWTELPACATPGTGC